MMARGGKPMVKRTRQILVTGSAMTVFVAAAVGVYWWSVAGASESYRAGDTVAGLTDRLRRTLPSDYPAVAFLDVTSAAGIDFRHFAGDRTTQIPEDLGSGVSWVDYDGDGWPDLFLANLPGPITLTPEALLRRPHGCDCSLYRNNGDGTFTDVTAASGIDFRGWAMAAAWADHDNNGHPDLFISAYGTNAFYVNNGDGTFTERTREAGLGGVEGFWAGAVWGDYDRDGFLDLYVPGYVRYQQLPPVNSRYDIEAPPSINPATFAAERNLLYRNNGDGTFTEIAAAAGVANPEGKSLQAVWVDLDHDGWPDLYVANDVTNNALFRNNGDGTFTDISHAAWAADNRSGMGIAVGDWNADGDMDLFITNWVAQENTLYTNKFADWKDAAIPVKLRFMDEADRYGLGQVSLDYVGWGTFFFDYTNSGLLDLFVANGHTNQEPDAPHRLVPMRDQLFWNRGGARGFFDVSPVADEYFARELVGRGAAFADFDNDGWLDVFVVNHGGTGVLLRNGGGPPHNWLKVQLQGTASNRQGIGALLRLVTRDGVQHRQVGVQGSYLSQNTLIEHFGLGSLERADTLEIRWPSGTKQVLTSLGANQLLRVVEP